MTLREATESSYPRRLRVTWVAEYPAHPKDYEGCDGDPVKMAALDQKSIDDGEFGAIELFDSAETVSVEIEVAP